MLLSGILFCADRGHGMYQQRYQTGKRQQDCYTCESYKNQTGDYTAHFIRTDLLTAGILSNLRQVTEYTAKHKSCFVKLLYPAERNRQQEKGHSRHQAA
ncbi:hypothetical protein K400107F7_02750 [Agathobaculum massiliense]